MTLSAGRSVSHVALSLRFLDRGGLGIIVALRGVALLVRGQEASPPGIVVPAPAVVKADRVRLLLAHLGSPRQAASTGRDDSVAHVAMERTTVLVSAPEEEPGPGADPGQEREAYAELAGKGPPYEPALDAETRKVLGHQLRGADATSKGYRRCYARSLRDGQVVPGGVSGKGKQASKANVPSDPADDANSTALCALANVNDRLSDRVKVDRGSEWSVDDNPGAGGPSRSPCRGEETPLGSTEGHLRIPYRSSCLADGAVTRLYRITPTILLLASEMFAQSLAVPNVM